MSKEKIDKPSANRGLISRRDFLKGMGAFASLAILGSFLSSCFRPQSPAPPMPPMTDQAGTSTSGVNQIPSVAKPVPAGRISLVKTRSRLEGVRRAIELLDANPVIGKTVMLKPNYTYMLPSPCCTHDDTLRSLVYTLKDMGAKDITMAERAWCEINTAREFQLLRVPDLARELGINLVNLQELPASEWIHLRPTGATHWQNGFEFPRMYVDAESVVQICILKAHGMGGHFTMSLKSAVGMIRPGPDYKPAWNETGLSKKWPWDSGNPYYPYLGEMHVSPDIRKMIAELNTGYKTDLVVLDGVDAIIREGPSSGPQAPLNLIIAGSDRVAIDAAGVAALRLYQTTADIQRGRVFEQEQIARAAELGLGVNAPEQIEIITGDQESRNFADKISEVLLA